MVKFISYDGKWPSLCMGTLVIEVDGKKIELKDCLGSGGSIWFHDDYGGTVEHGEWSVDLPKGLERYREEIEDCVNENVPWGCCGGCI
jgi:hypothetical protein